MGLRRLSLAAGTTALLGMFLVAGCSDGGSPSVTAEHSPSPSISTITAIPLPPPPPPTGRIRADMRQSSRDAAAGRMEVWVYNDNARPIRPTRISYADPRFRTTLPGTRLRRIPSQTERGFPLYLPARPACDHPEGRGTIAIRYGDTVRRVRVTDPTDVAGRYTTARCLELDVARVADLSFSDDLHYDGKVGHDATLTLLVRPTGHTGPVLRIDTVSGTPILTPVGTDVWRPEQTIHGTDPPSRIELPVAPNRCDDHAFLEAGGATAFKIGLHLGGEPGQITLRMSVSGAAHAIGFARRSCGTLHSVSGGG